MPFGNCLQLPGEPVGTPLRFGIHAAIDQRRREFTQRENLQRRGIEPWMTAGSGDLTLKERALGRNEETHHHRALLFHAARNRRINRRAASRHNRRSGPVFDLGAAGQQGKHRQAGDRKASHAISAFSEKAAKRRSPAPPPEWRRAGSSAWSTISCSSRRRARKPRRRSAKR